MVSNLSDVDDASRDNSGTKWYYYVNRIYTGRKNTNFRHVEICGKLA